MIYAPSINYVNDVDIIMQDFIDTYKSSGLDFYEYNLLELLIYFISHDTEKQKEDARLEKEEFKQCLKEQLQN